jgi:hypothetical protein
MKVSKLQRIVPVSDVSTTGRGVPVSEERAETGVLELDRDKGVSGSGSGGDTAMGVEIECDTIT